MIIFHEGLPRAGKSYEAMSERIVPAIAKGRTVVAYVEGIDHAKIAALANVTEERCRELLTALTREQVQTLQVDEKTGKVLRVDDHLPQLAVDNALIVLDEAQNFWGNKVRLSAEMTKFISEHGHRGIDVVLMGQDLRDVHAVWRRRVELKLCFLKLNGLKLPKWAQALTFGKFGTEASYSVTTYRHLGGDSFNRLGVSLRNYDPRYFGTYASFVADDTSTEVFTDDRAQVASHPLIKYGLPAALLAGVIGLWQAWVFFHPTPAPVAKVAAAPADRGALKPAGVSLTAPHAVLPVVVPPVDRRTAIERRMVDLAGKGRIRLAGLISSKQHTNGIVEWVQGGSVVVERLSLDALRALGVAVLITEDDVVQLAVGEYSELATRWPLEDMARVSDARTQSIRGPQPVTGAVPMPPEVVALGSFGSSRDLPGSISGGSGSGAADDGGARQPRVRVSR